MKKKMGFRWFKYFLLLGLGLWARSEYEKDHLITKTYHIKTNKNIKKNVSIVFLSDMHDKEFGKNNGVLLEEIRKIRPDYVLIGGDIPTIKKEADLQITFNLLEHLSKDFKVYYANGNHETRMREKSYKYGSAYQSFIKKLKELHIAHLENKKVLLESGIAVYGLDLEAQYYKHGNFKALYAADIRNKLGEVNEEEFSVLLAHSPNFFPEYADWGADLTLSGHFHGGTIRLYEDIGLMTPQYQFFNRNVVGLKKRGDKKMIISAGLGTHSVKIRLGNPPELVHIKIEK